MAPEASTLKVETANSTRGFLAAYAFTSKNKKKKRDPIDLQQVLLLISDLKGVLRSAR